LSYVVHIDVAGVPVSFLPRGFDNRMEASQMQNRTPRG
jgi:hypothetical protein